MKISFLKRIVHSLSVVILGLVFIVGSGGDSDDMPATEVIAPIVTVEGENPTTIAQGESYSDLGATAINDAGEAVQVTVSGEVDTFKAGTYTLTYTAVDSGNTTTTTRIINVLDKTLPVITLLGEGNVTVEQYATYVELGAFAKDNIADCEVVVSPMTCTADVDVVITGIVNTSAVGVYTVIYTATDSAGNESKVTRTVTVKAVLTDVSDFNIVETSLSEDDVSQLLIEGTAEDDDGNKGTLSATTDVVALKEIVTYDLEGNESNEEQIVFRSFNIGEWREKLNEETTLLARIFIDPILMNIPKDEQNKIALQLVTNQSFKEALLNQKLYIGNPKVFEAIYIKSVMTLSKIARELITDIDARNAMRQFQTSLSVAAKSNEIDNIGGSIRLTYDKDLNTFNFKNYHNIYMGMRPYEPSRDYSFLNTIEDNVIDPVSGGLVGTGISKATEWLNLDILGSPANTAMFGDSFDSDLFVSETRAVPSQTKTYEIYKYQGFGDITSYYNTMLVADALIGIGSNWTKNFDSFKDKTNDAVSTVTDTADTILSLIEMTAALSEYSAHFFGTDTDFSYTIENDIDNIRIFIEKIKPLLTNEDRYDSFLDRAGSDSFLDTKVINLLFGNVGIYPQDSNLAKAISEISDQKLKYKIYLASFFFQKYFDEVLSDKSLGDYQYYSLNDMHYIVPLWLMMPRDDAKKILQKYKYGTGANLGSKGVPAYIKLFTEDASSLDFLAWNKGFVKETIEQQINNLEQLANIADLIRNTSRSISNADLFSSGSLKIMLGFLKDSKIITLDANVIAAKIAKSIVPGSSQAKALLGANEAASWAIGTFTLPNKMYFKVQTDSSGNVELKYPPFAILGIMSDDVEEKNNWIGNKLYREEASPNILVVTGSSHKPIYNVYFMSKDESSIFEGNENFPENTFVKMNYNIRKSTSDTKSNFTDTLGNQNNVNNDISISPETIADGGSFNYNMVHSGDYGYYFDLYDAWRVEQGLNDAGVTIVNKTRGVYKEWIDARFNYPDSVEIDSTIDASSNTRYVYKVATAQQIGENLQIDRVGEDTLEIVNGNNFDVCFNVYYDRNNGNLITDDTYHYGDQCIEKNETISVALERFKDEDYYNGVKFLFFDKVALKYLEEEQYQTPMYHRWEEKSGGLEDLAHVVLLDEVVFGNDTAHPIIQYIEPSECIVDEINERFEISFDYKITDDVSKLEDISYLTDGWLRSTLEKTSLGDCINDGGCKKIDDKTISIINTYGFRKGYDWEVSIDPNITMFSDKAGNEIKVEFGSGQTTYSNSAVQAMKKVRMPDVAQTCTRVVPPNRDDLSFEVVEKGINHISDNSKEVVFDVYNDNYLGLVSYEYKRSDSYSSGSGRIKSSGGCPGTGGFSVCGGFGDEDAFSDTIKWTFTYSSQSDYAVDYQFRFCNQDDKCTKWFEYTIETSGG